MDKEGISKMAKGMVISVAKQKGSLVPLNRELYSLLKPIVFETRNGAHEKKNSFIPSPRGGVIKLCLSDYKSTNIFPLCIYFRYNTISKSTND